MATPQAPVEIGESHFDLEQILQAIERHPVLSGLLILAAFIFWISRKEGLVGSILGYKTARAELELKRVDNLRSLSNQIERRPGSQPAAPPAPSGDGANP